MRSMVMDWLLIFFGLLLFAAAVIGPILLYYRERRPKWLESTRAQADQLGVVDVHYAHYSSTLTFERPEWRGVLHITETPIRGPEHFTFSGTTRAPRSSWSLASRRLMMPPEGPGQKIAIGDPDLDKRFIVFAENPAEARAFFDEEMVHLLTVLDAGFFSFLSGPIAGITVYTLGGKFAVSVHGRPGDDSEHLQNVLRLIHRAAEHGSTVQSS